jgi:hypothetical protein
MEQQHRFRTTKGSMVLAARGHGRDEALDLTEGPAGLDEALPVARAAAVGADPLVPDSSILRKLGVRW